ncbi:MAG: hypothetical protein ACP5FL_09370 [Thermoplasmatota archaeon]
MGVSDQEGRRFFSLHTVRRILETYCPYQVSTEAVIQLRDCLEEISSTLAHGSVREFERLNTLRERQELKRLKRLNKGAIADYRFRLEYKYPETNENDRGSRAAHTGFGNPGSDTMSVNSTATPGTSTHDHGREVA